jgi:hypothetical protein
LGEAGRSDKGGMIGRGRPYCGPARCPLKPELPTSEPDMAGLYTIIAFIVVIAALNRIEFGRFD